MNFAKANTQHPRERKNFYTTELSTNNEVFATIEQNIAQKQYTLAASALVSVANQDDIDVNQQSYNALSLHYSNGTFTATDSLALINLCALCPYTDGFVVFRARALYNEVYHTIANFTDECNTTTNGSRLANNLNTNKELVGNFKIELYPNPTANNFNIITDVADAVLQIQIVDVQGKLMYVNKVAVQNYQTNVQPNLDNGIYFVTFTNMINNTVVIKKLIIQK